jgi:hypothetical protein
VKAMAEGALGLLGDNTRMGAMRDEARKTAQKRFCATLVVPHYVRYYQDVIAAAAQQ